MKVRGENAAWVEKKFHGKLSFIWHLKKPGTSAELGPTSAFSGITTSTPDFPHVHAVCTQRLQRLQLTLQQSSLYHTPQSEGQQEIPRRLHVSPKPRQVRPLPPLSKPSLFLLPSLQGLQKSAISQLAKASPSASFVPPFLPPPISPFFSPIFSSLYIILESQREKELRVTSRIQDLESTHLGSCPSFSSCYLCDFGQMTKFPNPSNSSVRGAKPGNHCFLPTYALNTWTFACITINKAVS